MSAILPAAAVRVLDASVAVWAVVPVVAPIDVLEQFVRWRQQRLRLVAPALWAAEGVSAIRRAVYAHLITVEEGRVAIEDLFALQVEMLPLTVQRCRTAFAWAERLGQARAYDGFYLALAEELGTELWTADRRLVQAVQQLGVTWTHWIGETTGAANGGAEVKQNDGRAE